MKRTSTSDDLLSPPDSAKGQLQREAFKALKRHEEAHELPTSIRFLFYELEQAGILSKNKTGARRADQYLAEAVKHLRDVGLVPWDWIVDETRRLHYFDGSATIARDLLEFLSAAHIDPWHGKIRPFILTESRTLSGVFARTIAPQYRVPVASTNGQCGGFLVTDIAPRLRVEKFQVAYFGDFDLAGSSIEANTRSVLKRHTGITFDEESWERIAITEVQANNLRSQGVEPIQKTDRRFADGHVHEAFEAEALGQGMISRILRDWLDERLPEPLARVHVRERRQRAKVRRLLETLK